MKVKVFKKINNKLIKDWKTLWDKSLFATTFNSIYWFESYINAFKISDYKIMTIYNKNKLIAVIPLINKRLFCIKVYSSGSDLSQRTGILCDFNNELLVKYLFRKLIKFGFINLELIDKQILSELRNLNLNVCITSIKNNPYLLLSKDQQGELILPKRRQIIKKSLGEITNIKLKTYDRNLSKLLPLVYKIDSESTKEKYGYSAFSDNNVKNFFTDLADKFKNKMLINILYFGEKPIAYEIGFCEKDVYIDSERAFIRGYEHLTPGNIMLVLLAEMLLKRNYKVFDLGPGVDNLKKSLAKNETQYFDCFLGGNFFICKYLFLMFSFKEKLFAMIFRYKNIYQIYKNIINFKN